MLYGACGIKEKEYKTSSIEYLALTFKGYFENEKRKYDDKMLLVRNQTHLLLQIQSTKQIDINKIWPIATEKKEINIKKLIEKFNKMPNKIDAKTLKRVE